MCTRSAARRLLRATHRRVRRAPRHIYIYILCTYIYIYIIYIYIYVYIYMICIAHTRYATWIGFLTLHYIISYSILCGVNRPK